MSYDDSLPTVRDRIRALVDDRDVENERFPDATYDTTIAAHTNWKLAAAEMAHMVATAISNDPSSYTDAGVMSVGWSNRVQTLRDLIADYRADAADEATESTVAVATSRQLTRAGASSEPEYRPSRGRRRW